MIAAYCHSPWKSNADILNQIIILMVVMMTAVA